MSSFPISYEEPVFRPPSEGKSYLIQVTIGCSHNKCTYCAMYKKKTYRVRTINEVKKDLFRSSLYFKSQGIQPKRLFLCDGDALAAPYDFLLQVLDAINEYFPSLERVGTYATAMNILEKSTEQLSALKAKKLGIAYIGLESGSDAVLKKIIKGNTAEEFIAAAKKLKAAGWMHSVIAMLGVGGEELSTEHCSETARIVSAMQPEYFSFLTTVPIPGTTFKRQVTRKQITLLNTKNLLKEMHTIISGLKVSDKHKMLFRTNHVSNQFQLGGVLPQDLETMLRTVDTWIRQCPENHFPDIDPSFL